MTRRIATGTAFALALTLSAGAAQAQLFRAYLAPDGNDGNPCTLQQPCRLLPAAIAAVASGGEIWLLDSANYNSATVNVNKSVTILAVPGAVGSVVATGGVAIAIATAGVHVALRNLVIVPLPGGADTGGVSMTNGASLTVEKCVLANLNGNAIAVTTPARVNVSDSTLRGNAIGGLVLRGGAEAAVTRTTISRNVSSGIFLDGNIAGTTTAVDVTDSTLDGNGFGVVAFSNSATGALSATVRSSLIAGSPNGIVSQSNAGATVSVAVSASTVSRANLYAIGVLNAGARVWASGNTVTHSAIGFLNSGGLFESASNNALRNNGADTSGTIMQIVMQ